MLIFLQKDPKRVTRSGRAAHSFRDQTSRLCTSLQHLCIRCKCTFLQAPALGFLAP
jgi:hypothetical protein